MNMTEIQAIIEALGPMTGEAKSAFVWWLVFYYGVKALIPLAWIVGLCIAGRAAIKISYGATASGALLAAHGSVHSFWLPSSLGRAIKTLTDARDEETGG